MAAAGCGTGVPSKVGQITCVGVGVDSVDGVGTGFVLHEAIAIISPIANAVRFIQWYWQIGDLPKVDFPVV
jgi:hypothetical protein